MNLVDYALVDRGLNVINDLLNALSNPNMGLGHAAPKQAADARKKANALHRALSALKAEIEKPLQGRDRQAASRRTGPSLKDGDS